MSKRGAASELNDRNWDAQEEPEEAGQFVQASTEVLQRRQIVKAKRKTAEDKPSGSTFSGFSGFSLKPTTVSDATKSLFSNGTENKNLTNNSVTNKDSQNETGQIEKDKTLVNGGSKETSKKSAYYQSLKSLNASVVTWITKHVEKNPYCILTPIFKDYEKHMDRLEKEKQESEKKEENKDDSKSKPLSGTNEKPSTEASGFSFGGSFSSSTGSTPAFSGFNFGSASDDKKSTFSFGATKPTLSQETSDEKKPAFSFGITKPTLGQEASDEKKPAFSFAISKPPSSSQETTDSQGDEEYVPPKPEVVEIQEEGSTYTKRCKLFYQKDGEWKERGVGNLHLKSCDGGKTQLIVRADTSLGNILLNIMLSSSIPTKRQGKNNVSLFCIPNPPVDPKADPEKPVSMLIRVKKAEDADELAEKLEEAKA